MIFCLRSSHAVAQCFGRWFHRRFIAAGAGDRYFCWHASRSFLKIALATHPSRWFMLRNRAIVQSPATYAADDCDIIRTCRPYHNCPAPLVNTDTMNSAPLAPKLPRVVATTATSFNPLACGVVMRSVASVCPVRALTFESLDVETLVFGKQIRLENRGLSRHVLYLHRVTVKVTWPKRSHDRNYRLYTHVYGWPALDWKAILFSINIASEMCIEWHLKP